MAALITVLIFIVALALSLPVLIFALASVIGWRGLRYARHAKLLRVLGNSWRTGVLERRLRSLQRVQALPTSDEMAARIVAVLEADYPALDICVWSEIQNCARALYEAEGFALYPVRSHSPTELAAAQYRDRLRRLIASLGNLDPASRFEATIVPVFRAFLRHMPPMASQGRDSADEQREIVSVRLLESMAEPGRAVEAVCQAASTAEEGFFREVRERLQRNQYEMSGQQYPFRDARAPKLTAPSAHKGSKEEVVHGYLAGTPLEALFALRLPFELPDSVRFEHQWIVAGSGHGKTQCLQYMIGRDLERVARGEASVIVIDSQGDMIRTIAGLKLFVPGQALYDKLVLIDPTDIEYPVALNLFDAGLDRLEQYGALERERLLNGVIELYDFVLGSLLSAELTQKQAVVFRFLTRLMLNIPGATIHTFRELMEPDGYRKYEQYIAKLEGTARAFFETEFNSRQFEDTKRQVLRRLWGVLENRTFERMFSHPKNKVDLFTEMNEGKVILINTAKDLLKQNGTELFGRFFIALIAQAGQERAILPPEARTPCYCYIDEASEYFDQNVASILETARKQKIALCCANQYGAQLSPKLFESFAANTSTKLIGGVSDKDARAFAHMLRCTPEFILDQRKGQFAMFVRNHTAFAISLKIPFGHLESATRMTPEEQAYVLEAIRKKYAAFSQATNFSCKRNLGVDGTEGPDPAASAEW